MRRLAILGSTGSIGIQTLDVISKIEGVEIVAMSCGHNFSLFTKQLERYRPAFAASLSTEENPLALSSVKRFFHGEEGIEEMLESSRPDMVIVGVSGAAGLRFSLKAIEICKRLCLANKESIVCGGDLLIEGCKEKSVELIPVDSEHSGLFQLLGEGPRPDRIFITASGGALRDWSVERSIDATPGDVLKHPVWSMGRRITIDSATMVNKGLEVIEAHYLFRYDEEDIETYICRNSYIHAGIVYRDGVVKLHSGTPDMRIPIAYSLTYPFRERVIDRGGITGIPLLLEEIDGDKYPALELARNICGKQSKQIAYNAADEIAVEAFLRGEIKFGRIYNIIERTVSRIDDQRRADYRQILEIDKISREIALEEVSKCF
ncbi:MAG TPA: 1-deoxy-D-xylulose-5-phosphate reductoisomerase [Mesotoga sp.]|nr:1-deoxy-D-xylulose-5-phosphate reductoisomerase [Mesotoga sp.]